VADGNRLSCRDGDSIYEPDSAAMADRQRGGGVGAPGGRLDD